MVTSLYVHVPFCFHKCHYCDFYSIVEEPSGMERQSAFTDRLIAELDWWSQRIDLQPTTLFVGGGTPTLLRTDLWKRLLGHFHTAGLLRGVVEFTVEANPETVNDELIALLVASGVNRFSIGAQSFDPVLLKTLERWHEPQSVARAMTIIRSQGIDNINLDLIFAIPGQDESSVECDLDHALELRPAHLSYYGLTYEPNTAMTQRLKLGRVTPVDEDAEACMYLRVIERMQHSGFEHYEVSNWAGRGGRCLHNMNYWTNANWLGIGPAAASHVEGRRWKNQPHLGRWLETQGQPPVQDVEQLDESGRCGERLMLALRLREGVRIEQLDSWLPTGDPRQRTLEELCEQGLLERAGGSLRLTQRGLFVADAVIVKLL